MNFTCNGDVQVPYRRCFIPECPNNSTITPEKLFLRLPKDPQRRKAWLHASKLELDSFSIHTKSYACQDHFNVTEDLENLLAVRMVGAHPKLKPDVVPHIFECQRRVVPERANSLVRKSKKLVKNLLVADAAVGNSQDPLISPCKSARIYKQAMQENSEELKLKLEFSDVLEKSTENDKQTDGFFVTNEAQHIDTNFVSQKVKIERTEETEDGGQNTNDNSNNNMFSDVIDIKKEKLEPNYDNCKKNGSCLNVDTSVKEINVAEIQTSVINKKVGRTLDIIEEETLEVRVLNSTLRECMLCKKICRSIEELKQHFTNSHPNETFMPCNLCNKIYNSMQGLQQHFRRFHPNKIIPGIDSAFPCRICCTFYKNKVSLKRHQYDTHKNCEANFKIAGDESSKQMPCTVCSKIYKTVIGLKKHMKQLHPKYTSYVCNVCGTICNNSKALIEHRIECLKSFECHVCHKKFSLVYTLKKHVQIHNKNRKHAFKCEICSKQFYHKYSLQYHLKVQHTSGYKCLKSFECHICHKKLSCNVNLKLHLKLHDKDRKRAFTCEICSKKFYEKRHLGWHLELTHKILPLICKICDQKFQSKELLDEHISLTHESAMNLEQHTATQSVIQQITKYKCNICGKSFTQKDKLKIHIVKAHDILVEPDIKQQQETESMQEQEPGIKQELQSADIDQKGERKRGTFF